MLAKAAKDLGCEMRNENFVDLTPVTLGDVIKWLITNGFTESKVRKGRWTKEGVQLMLDSIGGFLYKPSL